MPSLIGRPRALDKLSNAEAAVFDEFELNSDISRDAVFLI